MGEGKLKTFRDPISTITGPYSSLAASRNRWVDMEAEDDASDLISSTSSSTFDESSTSNASSSCEELVDDASSSSSTNGPLYELSNLMATLPIKRGLSKHFQGKSQSFTSLSDVSCLEDLVKNESGYGRKKMMIKTCTSYGGGLDVQKKVISKKNTKSNSAPRFIGSPRRPPLIPAKRSTVFAITQS
ncbi:hypothetical protein MKW98_029332 [Papaver atlanticum]|uniref:Oxidative stress 3 n=1 Tax=Papaver atlanticum TaxID=357466 RepID=A0AAD4SKN3_9MAGN|nr:hypothetical protein MKW98_029332 [Papaver atlanticum]